jgi:hypothetical protein
MADHIDDLLTLGDQVSFIDDSSFGLGGTSVFVKGNGTVIYNGTSHYQGSIIINNANFKVNGSIDDASVSVCRNISFSLERGKLSGTGTLTGNVSANSGSIIPDVGQTLTLGSLNLNSASSGTLGSLVHIDVNSSGTSLVAVNGAASLAGTLEVNLDSNTIPGQYTILTSSGITGTFDTIVFTGKSSTHTVSYLPEGAPTFVQIEISFPSSVSIPATVNGSPILNPAVVCCGRPVILGPLPIEGSGPTTYRVIAQTGKVTCHIGETNTQTYLKMYGTQGSCTIVGTKEGIDSEPLTVIAP